MTEGDLADSRGWVIEGLAHFERALRTLRAPLGLFAAPGSHDSRLFVSRGAGLSFVPLRVGTRSEVVLRRPK